MFCIGIVVLAVYSGHQAKERTKAPLAKVDAELGQTGAGITGARQRLADLKAEIDAAIGSM